MAMRLLRRMAMRLLRRMAMRLLRRMAMRRYEDLGRQTGSAPKKICSLIPWRRALLF